MLRDHKTKFLLRNLLPKSMASNIHKLFRNLPMKARIRKGVQKPSNAPPTDIKELINTSVFLTNLEELSPKPKRHKAKFPNENSLIKSISSTYLYLKRQFLTLTLGFLAIFKFFKSLILKIKPRKNLQRTSKNSPINAKSLTSTDIFLIPLRKTFLGPINVFSTYIERSLSLKEHLNLISCILAKALTIGIASFTLVFVILGFVLLLL